MSASEKKKVERRISKIHEDLESGADFAKIAKSVSESDSRKGQVIGPIIPERDEKPMLPQILEAVKNTPEGEITDVIQTKHGFNIIKVTEKTEEGYVEFDKVKRNIENVLRGERLRDRQSESLFYIARNTPGITLNEDVFTADDRTSDSVVMDLGDRNVFTLKDFNERRRMPGQPEPETNRERLLELFKIRSALYGMLSRYGKHKGVDEEEEFQKEYQERREKIISDAYYRKLVNEIPKPTLLEVQQYYEKNKERYAEPKKYDISLIGLRISKPGERLEEEKKEARVEELKERLAKVKEEIKTREDFEDKAQAISEDPTRSRKGHIGEVAEGYRRGFDGRLPEMEAGEISDPFVYGSFVYLLRVNDVTRTRQRDFKESRQTVQNELIRERRQELEDKLADELLEKRDFEFLLEVKEEKKEE